MARRRQKVVELVEEKLEVGQEQEEEARQAPTEVVGDGAISADSELSESEARLREELEREVVESFYRAGKALLTLQEMKLYRNTHATFEEYIQEVFGFHRVRGYQLIGAAKVIDNLRECKQFVYTDRELLPTTESQCRPLSKLSPEEQVAVWDEALTESKGKIPPARVVQEVIQRIRERKRTPISYQMGDICEIQVKENPDLSGMGGYVAVVKEIGEFGCTVETVDGEMHVRPEYLKEIPLGEELKVDAQSLVLRLRALRLELPDDALVRYLLKYFARKVSLSPLEGKVFRLLEKEADLE
jgi:hypothetical protein